MHGSLIKMISLLWFTVIVQGCDQAPNNQAIPPVPYTLYADGQILQDGLTDETGAIYFSHIPTVAKYEVELFNKQRHTINLKQDTTEITESDLLGLSGYNSFVHTDQVGKLANHSDYRYKTHYIRYRDIYIHSKLLVVDDLFTLVSSANINTRSFWVDSESGIAIPDNQFATDMRNELWLMHTKKSINGGQQTASDAISCDAPANYEYWDKQMTKNWKHKAKGEPLECHLTRFWETEMPYAPAVD